MTLLNPKDSVTIREGYGYDRFSPAGFARSDGTVTGTITHIENQSAWVRLPNGKIVETLTDALTRALDLNITDHRNECGES